MKYFKTTQSCKELEEAAQFVGVNTAMKTVVFVVAPNFEYLFLHYCDGLGYSYEEITKKEALVILDMASIPGVWKPIDISKQTYQYGKEPYRLHIIPSLQDNYLVVVDTPHFSNVMTMSADEILKKFDISA